jgi:hypothetical protein
VPILLKKSFPADEQNFSGPLMRFARRDVKAPIAKEEFNGTGVGVSYLFERSDTAIPGNPL